MQARAVNENAESSLHLRDGFVVEMYTTHIGDAYQLGDSDASMDDGSDER